MGFKRCTNSGFSKTHEAQEAKLQLNGNNCEVHCPVVSGINESSSDKKANNMVIEKGEREGEGEK